MLANIELLFDVTSSILFQPQSLPSLALDYNNQLSSIGNSIMDKDPWAQLPISLLSKDHFLLEQQQLGQTMLTLKSLVYTFARAVRRGGRGSSLSLTQQAKAGQQSIEQQELQDEIQPLSYDKQVQESIKAKIAQELMYNYEGEDPNPHKLVHRPSKGAAWGLGGQLMLASRKVQLQGLKPQIDQITEFLQLHQVKDIYVHDFFAENPDKPESNRKRYAILGSCFSTRHCWKVGIELKNAFNLNSAKTKLRRKQKYDPIYAILNGGKDQEWSMVEYKDYQISLMTEEQREAMDLEWKWNNPTSEEIIDKHIAMKQRKGRKRQFEDL